MRFCPRCAAPLETREVGGQVRSVCAAADCSFVHWDNPVPVVAALIECVDRDGRILLARNAGWTHRFFALITGFLERTEAPEDGMRREIREEVSLDTDSLELIGLYPYACMNQLLIVYHARCRGDIVLNEELSEYVLVAPADLKPWPRGTGLAMRDWMQRRGLHVPDWEGPLPNPLGTAD